MSLNILKFAVISSVVVTIAVLVLNAAGDAMIVMATLGG